MHQYVDIVIFNIDIFALYKGLLKIIKDDAFFGWCSLFLLKSSTFASVKMNQS